jgi:hypothetical protein
MTRACISLVLSPLLLLAAALRFDVTDARGKKPSGVTVEAEAADDDGWRRIHLEVKGKGSPVLIWPYDGLVKAADGPGEIPVLVMEPADAKALSNRKLAAHLAAAEMLGAKPASGLDQAAYMKALEKPAVEDDPFVRGVALLLAKRPAEAAEPLALALRERERQLTRVPSEIYPAAMLSGRAFLEAGKFDAAALAFLKALKQRPSDETAARLREEALEKAGKPGAK